MATNNTYTKYLEWGALILSFGALMWFSRLLGWPPAYEAETTTEKIGILLGIIIMIHLVLAVHELGHLLVGLLQGFRFELFVVGFLGIKREEEQTKVYFNKNFGYYGGVAATSPQDDSSENAKKFARVLLAGPAASVLLAVICFLLVNAVISPWQEMLYFGGITSMAIFLATTIPSSTGMFFTDRKRYQRLVRPGKDQQVELAILNIMGKFAKDGSYQNIAKQDIEVLIADELPFFRYFGLFNMICWQLEHTGQVEEALQTEYDATAKEISTSMVKVFDQEIEKYTAKYGAG